MEKVVREKEQLEGNVRLSQQKSHSDWQLKMNEVEAELDKARKQHADKLREHALELEQAQRDVAKVKGDLAQTELVEERLKEELSRAK